MVRELTKSGAILMTIRNNKRHVGQLISFVKLTKVNRKDKNVNRRNEEARDISEPGGD